MAAGNVKNLCMTKKELAELAGYSYRQLYNIDKDLPDNRKLFVIDENDPKKYNVTKFIQRWVEFNINRDAEITNLEDAKTAHEIIKTRKTELEVAKMEAALVDVNEIRILWGNIANTVMQNFIRLPSKIAPRVVGMMSIETIRAEIDNEIRAVLNGIADTPIPQVMASITEDDDKTE